MEKIVYVCPNGFVGGAERALLDICYGHNILKKVSIEIIFFKTGAAVEEAKNRGIEHRVLTNSFRFSSPIQLFKSLIEFRKIISEIRPKLIVYNMAYPAVFGSVSLFFKPIKKVLFQHGPIGNFFDFVSQFISFDLVIFNSSYLKNVHEKKPYMTHYEKNFLAYLPINPKEVDAVKVKSIKENYLTGDKKFLVGIVGRICSIKGFDIFIESIAKLSNKEKSKCCFLIIGSPNSEEEEKYKSKLLKQVELLNLKNEVKFLDFQTEIQNYYAALDLLIQASIVPEGFGLTIAEAMYHDTFVIGPNCGGVIDFLAHNQTGLTFNPVVPDSADRLSLYISKFLANNQHQKIIEIKQNAKKLVNSKFNLKTIVSGLEDKYIQIIK